MTWALIDSSAMAYRARHTMGGLSHGDLATGVLFGFFEQLRAVCADPRVNTTRVAMFFDSRQSYRRDAFPWYKAKRRADRTPEEWAEIEVMDKQLQLLRKRILPEVGFPAFMQVGLESDDLIAQAARQVSKAVIVTGDGDLYQCLTECVHWYDPCRNLYLDGPGALMARKRVGPADWIKVKCLAGCDTDNVPGIPGIGEKSATDWIWKILKGKRMERLEAGLDIAERNRELIELPHPKTRHIKLADPVYDAGAFFRWAKELGFRSYTEGPRREAWEAFFAGEARPVPKARRRGEKGLL